MSLAAMIAAHDDAALEALTSKGLVRRARREFEAGLAAVSARSSTSATVIADGATVHIDARGLAQSRCTCPAGGICRHILLASMALRAAAEVESIQLNSQDAPTISQPAASARMEICALTSADLLNFAGTDWNAAIALAEASDEATIADSASSCRVEFATASISVTFIAGQGLKSAAYKGPKSRARLITAAAAILLRSRHGVAPETVTGEDTIPETALGVEFLADAQASLASATRIVLGGSSPIAADTLFDLAISARAEAAPRLAAELRRLARMASLAAMRDVGFETELFLAEAARAFALIEALKSDPANGNLTGTLRRGYRPHAAFDLWMLGASAWRSETGARGLTFYGFAPHEKRWHSVNFARAAGQDPSFDPKTAYRLPLWAAGLGSALMGRVLNIPEPLVAFDGSIAVTLPKPATISGRLGSASTLLEAGAAHDGWNELFKDLAQRLTGGLKHRSRSVPAMLAPAKFGNLRFNELGQVYEWEAIDRAGGVATLILPTTADALAQRLHREGHRFRLVLVEASIGLEGALLKPIAIGVGSASGLDIVNLDLDSWQPQNGVQAAVGAMRGTLSKFSTPAVTQTDTLHDLAEQALSAAAAVASGNPRINIDELMQRCQAAGLLTLSSALQRMTSEPEISRVFWTAYLASEIQALRIWM